MTENKKNKIIINREKISSEEVRSRQNFGNILSKHQKITKPPFYKQKKFYLTFLLVVIVGLLLYLSEKEEQKITQQPGLIDVAR